ncbi:hypothetical protein ALC53_04412 [Atta colombica]|uniref:Peptidase aspartic putative domain-containing protein n=1 Tax=Atta colombica TaxID=520822 RepID=A0A195BLY9_9HYME|nr:hypothetical protein ALC53_04412 [Atta colombica]
MKYLLYQVNTAYNWKHVAGLELADSNPMSSKPIDIIIGANLFGMLILNGVRKSSEHEPTAQNTTLGWILSGLIASFPIIESIFALAHHGIVLEILDRDLHCFWEIEEVPTDYQRIVWQPTSGESITDYRLLIVTYSIAAVPYLALRVLEQLVDDEDAKFPLAVPVLCSSSNADGMMKFLANFLIARSITINDFDRIVQSLFPGVSWSHVPTHIDPAKCVSFAPDLFQTHDLWCLGPPWLHYPPESWPNSCPSVLSSRITLRIFSMPCTLRSIGISHCIILRGQNCYELRFLNRLRCSKNPQANTTTLLPEEIQKLTKVLAKHYWLKTMQATMFPNEIAAVTYKRLVPKNSSLYALNPYMDENGLVRIQGRLRRVLPARSLTSGCLNSRPIAPVFDNLDEFTTAPKVATIKTGRSEYKRLIVKLCFLSVTINTEESRDFMAGSFH